MWDKLGTEQIRIFLNLKKNDENNRSDFGKVGNYLEFTYERIKFNLLCKYLTHNITWS